ncbi:MAG TPA: tyrosine-type recombinase/integrase [Pirellulales bacterium]|nr:tyrosine-type recombinase/integrase [Pirellulales bacterium]
MNNDNENRIQIGDHVTIYRRGKTGIWTAEYWYNRQHRRTSLKTRNLRIARHSAVRMDDRLAQGQNPVDRPIQKGITLRQAADDFVEYLITEDRRRKTIIKYKGVLKKFITFSNSVQVARIANVDLLLIDRYRAFRKPIVSERSMHNEGVILKTFLEWCADRRLIAANPLSSRRFRRPKNEPRGGPNLDQVNAILAIADRDLMSIIAVAAFTGRRSGEIQHLLLDDVDFQGNWIYIVSRPGAETKTGNSTKVPIHPRLRAILETLPKTKRRWFFTAAPSVQYPEGGHHLNMRDINERFQKLLKILTIPAGKKHGGFTFHSLRSFFKTFCVNAGIPRDAVDKWQDHAGDRRPTAGDGYYQPWDEESQEFMKKVPFGDGKPAADAGN